MYDDDAGVHLPKRYAEWWRWPEGPEGIAPVTVTNAEGTVTVSAEVFRAARGISVVAQVQEYMAKQRKRAARATRAARAA